LIFLVTRCEGITAITLRRTIYVSRESVTTPAIIAWLVDRCWNQLFGITLSHHFNPFLSHQAAYVVLLPLRILLFAF
jgi:hypothetical protein